MNEVEKYLFDLQGYLIIENVLTAVEIATLNALIDAQNLPEPSLESGKARFGNFLNWGKPFCDLLDHPKLLPYLKVILGDGFRLDHYYGIYLRKGTGLLNLHGGNTPYDPPEYYHFRNGHMHNGLVVVAWNLTDTGPEHGGFCCIPGSHKANYPLPQELREAHYQSPAVGESRLVSHLHRSAHPRHYTLVGPTPAPVAALQIQPRSTIVGANYAAPPTAVELTPRQQILFEKPYFNARPSLFAEQS